jgi:hypothetical protein
MLTRAKLKLGKGELVSYKSEIEKRLCKHNMASEGKERRFSHESKRNDGYTSLEERDNR